MMLAFENVFTYTRKLSANRTLIGILILGFVLRIWVSQTPFLGEWDERFHALVAKNLIEHPLKPTLYETPLLEYDYKEWSWNHVWLSKPPLPLWLMAGSMSLLGIDEFALRFPSVILSSICICFTFLIGKKLFNSKIGMLAAFFHAIHGMTLEVGGGRLSSDHIETCFLFFFQLSLLLIVDFYQRKKNCYRLAFLIGLVIGLAFMSKWIAAGFIPVIWLVIGLLVEQRHTILQLVAQLILMFFGFLIVSLPWLLFIHFTYPIESNYMFSAMFTPIAEAIQGHNEPWYHYLDRARIVFGEIIYLPLIWIGYVAGMKRPNKLAYLFVAITIFIPMFLLSIMETKRVTYLLMSSVGFFILSAVFIQYLSVNRSKLSYRRRMIFSLLIFLMWILPIRYSIERLKPFHSFAKEKDMTHKLKQIKSQLPNDRDIVIFNEQNPIRCMFYLDRVTAYSWIPAPEIINKIQKKGYDVYIKNESNELKRNDE